MFSYSLFFVNNILYHFIIFRNQQLRSVTLRQRYKRKGIQYPEMLDQGPGPYFNCYYLIVIIVGVL